MSEQKKQKKIRGLDPKIYARYMHKIERGETTENNLIRRGILKRSNPNRSRGIAKNRNGKLFSNRYKDRGKGGPGECKYPKCINKISRRGLCNTHRIEARRYIRAGKTTEINLINRGLLLPKSSGGNQNPRRNPSKKARNPSKRARAAKVKATIKGFPAKLLESPICLYPGCKTLRKGGSRGLCKKHYSQYKRKKKKLSDKKKRVLDKDLVKRRLLLPIKVKPRKSDVKSRKLKRRALPDSSAFEIGASIRGSIRRGSIRHY